MTQFNGKSNVQAVLPNTEMNIVHEQDSNLNGTCVILDKSGKLMIKYSGQIIGEAIGLQLSRPLHSGGSIAFVSKAVTPNSSQTQLGRHHGIYCGSGKIIELTSSTFAGTGEVREVSTYQFFGIVDE